jgi:hypothetical protein
MLIFISSGANRLAMERLFQLIDQYVRATFAPIRVVKVIEEDTLLGNDDLYSLFSLLELNSRITPGMSRALMNIKKSIG